MKPICSAGSHGDLSRWLAALFLPWLFIAGCGGGGGDAGDIFPFWVQTDVLVADIDDDGDADVVTLAMLVSNESTRTGKLTVHRQASPGVFAAAETYNVGLYPWRMVLADIDGDDAPDLVVADVGNSATDTGQAVWLLRQDSGNPGLFTAAQELAVAPVRPYDLAVTDVDGDDVPDIVLADSAGLGVGAALLRQDAGNRGSFLPAVSIPLPGNAFKVALGDVDNDGLADLVFRVGTDTGSELAITYRLDGGGLSAAATLSPQTGLNTQTLAVTHYDTDGLADIVEFFTPASSAYEAVLMTLLQAPAGTFTPVATSLAGVKGINCGVVADLNQDGRPDFASVGFYPVGSPTTVESTLNIFLQSGVGAFSLSRSVAMPISASRIAAGDVDGDGLNDLVVVGDNRVVILRQTSPGSFGSPLLVSSGVAIWN